MVKQLLVRGALSGAVAGLVTFLFARIFIEPWISRAIDYEGARDAAQNVLDHATQAGHSHEEGAEIFSRAVQMNVGVGVGLLLFGAAMGALVAVGFVVATGRVGRIRPFQLGLLVPLFCFLGIFAVPFAKYPANPPAIGHEDTIHARGTNYLLLVLVSCVLLWVAVVVGQWLHRTKSLYLATVLAGLGYLAVMGVVFAVLPSYHEVPKALTDANGMILLSGFPADVLANFRVYSIVNQVLLWGTIALLFAPQAQRLLAPSGAQPDEALV